MKKYLFTAIIALVAMPLWAAQNSVFDITRGDGLQLTPGGNNIINSCSFNWGGSKQYPIEEFFQGATSYEWDTNLIGTNIRCTNIKTDITGNKVTVPYVDQSISPNLINVSSVRFASTATVGTFFTVAESKTEYNATYVTAGVVGTPDYFYCEVPTRDPSGVNKSLELQWLLMTGIEKRIANGWILSMTWFGQARKCQMRMTFDPESSAPPPPPPPVSCPVGCVAAP